MAPQRSPASTWFALVALAATASAQRSSGGSKFWTATTRYQDCISTDPTPYTRINGAVTTYTYSTTCTIKDSVSPTVSPYSTSTDNGYYYDDLALVYQYYSDGAVASSDLYDRRATSSSSQYTYYSFVMPVTMEYPSSCPTPVTWSTNASVNVPTQVLPQITPLSVETSSPTRYAYKDTMYETWYLTSGAAPFTSTENYYYSYYIADCSTPYSYESGSRTYSYSYPSYTGSVSGGSSGGGSSGSDRWEVCYLYGGCTSLKTWVIIIATIIPALFLLGFLESYFWFRRLMLGKGCLRFGTISWICISLWVACFTRSQSRRSPDDQKILREKWKQTGFGTALGLWFKWGFRHKYPVPLLGQYSRNTVGIVPEGQPLPVPGMVQTSGTYPPGGPPPPGGIYYIVPPEGQGPPQTYYTAPPGWTPAPNGQGMPMPPGQAYMPPADGSVSYYGEQAKGAPAVSTSPVSPVTGAPQPVPSPVSTVTALSINAVEAPAPQQPAHPPTGSPPSQPSQPAQLPTGEPNPPPKPT